jgi:hypothetical protein
MAQITGCARNTAPAGTWTLDIQDQTTQIKLVIPEKDLKTIVWEMVDAHVAKNNSTFRNEISTWLNSIP